MSDGQEKTRKQQLDEIFTDPVFMANEWNGSGIDPFLQELVGMVNKAPVGFGITLVVPGGVVTGNMISKKRYFELLGDSMASAWPGESKEDIRAAFANRGIDVESENDGEIKVQPQCIHLENAKVVSGTTFIPSNGCVWRGRISAVSGYSMGVLST